MAITPSSDMPVKLIKDYVPLLQARMLSIILLSSILIGLSIGMILIATEVFTLDSVVLWLLILSSSGICAASGLLVLTFMTVPLRRLMRALAHVSGESVDGSLPRPHADDLKKNGLATALQTVYDLDLKKGGSASGIKETTSTKQLDPLLSRFNGAIIALGKDGGVIYASKKAPLYTDKDTLKPSLLFSGTDSLTSWLATVEETSVQAERIWRRIPDRAADQEDVRIFDVYASYQKGAEFETIITLVDQTSLYQTDEEDLNFIAFAAHELRGPITVIRGYLDVMQDELEDILQDDQKELFSRLTVSANRLSSYINNILNTARYDRRHLTANLVRDTYGAIYNTIADDMALRARSQHRLLSTSIPTDLPEIAADRASISEVMSNLIDNAIKYSNEGGAIQVSASQKGDFVEFIVADHGIGMPSNVIKNLFQKFYRSHRSRETVAGSGIGLYISKAIVESHGGTISVQSNEGVGSTFVVSLPTYASVAEKLSEDNNRNEALISQGRGWIKNHSMYRG